MVKRTDSRLLQNMANHYSAPKGFVGRNICYAVMHDGLYYGGIVGGSATLHLPGRNEYFSASKSNLRGICNNLFYHVEKVDGKYPMRNFTAAVLNMFIERIQIDWRQKYGDELVGIESLVELPRTGEIYRRCGFDLIGQTIGYTCKRSAGKGTDTWSGKRVWDTNNLRPKLVFVKKLK